MRAKPNNLVQTIERASLILDMLGQSPQGMSIRDLSDRRLSATAGTF